MSGKRARRTAQSRRPRRGWGYVGLALLTFLLVGSAIAWRRARGYAQARELRDLTKTRAQLVAERAALEGDVRVAASRGRLGPIAERKLGMRVPDDTQVVIVQRAAAAARVKPATAARPDR